MDNNQEEKTAYTMNRGRGILTPDDRKYLTGQKEYSHPESARNRRAKIRQRVQNSILDFALLEYLEARDREQIANSTDPEITSGLSSAYIFLYDLLVKSKKCNKDVDLNLGMYIEQAVQVIDQKRGYRSEVSVDTEREELEDPDVIFERAKEKGFLTLTGPEMELLWISEEVDAAAFAKFINQLFPDEENIRPRDILRERKGWKMYQEEMEQRR